LENLYICKPAKVPTFMQPCNYDYECASGETCSSSNRGANLFQQDIRRCLLNGDSASCRVDFDCTPPNVCRLRGNYMQCVLPSDASIGTGSIRSKFVPNL
uniref:EB domain-containing protein n=1 Tax=Gongylonema pulchrum TaxID=637853 RepID=A0A183F0M7_9BILA